MNQQELKTILDLHRKWVLGEEGGSRANLRGADLSLANLYGADLSDASLSSANLSDANLRGANLYGASLSSADLSGANLSDANLRGADLRGANLSDANLRGADLSDASLDPIKEDFYKVLDLSKNEILGLYEALMCGLVDGACYEGECACLVGTIANIRHEKYNALTTALRPDGSRPSERWFLAIRKGDIPQNNQVSEITARWMREWMDKNEIKYPEYKIMAVEK